MNYLTIISMVLKYAPMVESAIKIATSNEDLYTRLKEISQPLVTILEDVGSALFPKAASTLHAVGGALAAFDPDTTKWLQGALNSLVTPSPNLVVDGIYGAKTRDAVMALQTKLGLKADGLAGQITQAAIQALLNNFKLTVPATATASGIAGTIGSPVPKGAQA